MLVVMPPLLSALVRDFLASERLKLRRWLVDRIRCELDLDDREAEAAVAAVEAAGLVRVVEISHYDCAAQEMTRELAVAPGAAVIRAAG